MNLCTEDLEDKLSNQKALQRDWESIFNVGHLEQAA